MLTANILCNQNNEKIIFEIIEKTNLFDKISLFNGKIEDKSQNFIFVDNCQNGENILNLKQKYLFAPIIIFISEKNDFDILYSYVFDEYIFISEDFNKIYEKLIHISKKTSWEISLNRIFENEKKFLEKENDFLYKLNLETKAEFINFFTSIVEIIYNSKLKHLSFHANNVGYISGVISEELNASSHIVTCIEWSAFLHDIYLINSNTKTKDLLIHNKLVKKEDIGISTMISVSKNLFERDIFRILSSFLKDSYENMETEAKIIHHCELIDIIFLKNLLETSKNFDDFNFFIEKYIETIAEEKLKNAFLKAKPRIFDFYKKFYKSSE